MAKPQYQYAHQQERARWVPVVAAGQAVCAEPVCLMKTRWIPPGSKWHLSHDPSGTRWLGPSHARCNGAENARRNNPKRGRHQPRRPWVL